MRQPTTIENDFLKLRHSIQTLDSYEKEQSILLNCLERIIITATNNEFEGLVWKARVGKSSGKIAAKIQFNNMSLLRRDLSEIFSPTIENLKTIFANQRLALSTNVERDGQLIKRLECTIQIQVPEQKTHLDLP